MKKLLSIIICFALIITALPFIALDVSAATSGTTGDCTWTLDGTVLTISGNGAMEDYYFDSNLPWGNDITEVIIENGVTNIGEYAFYMCALNSAIIPDSVTSIGFSSFEGCISLKSITIPDSIISIGAGAFEECKKLINITIPDSVISIGNGAFYKTEWYESQPDGLIYAGKVAYKYKGSCPETVIIKDGTLGIAGNAFFNCSLLKYLTIPDSVRSIGTNAFKGCKSLNYNIYNEGKYLGNENNQYVVLVDTTSTNMTEFEIANSTKILNDSAFLHCSSLNSIIIPDSVTSIESGAFYYCTSLTSVIIPDSITSIGSYAFSCCISLTDVTIPDSVMRIETGVFSSCESITSITIPNSVTSIGNNAFNYCTSLTNINIPDSVTSIGDFAFSYCTTLTSITIPDSVRSICEYVFSYCESITSITIPNSVTSIESGAFYYCTSLTNINIPDNVTSIGGCTFEECTSLKNVYYRGSEEEKNEINIYFDNECLIEATWHYNSCIGSAEHIYDNACDTTCNVCKAERTVPDHVYDNACDKCCNECNLERIVPDHVYDNACDTTCNICGLERSITHTYNDANDTECDVCGICRPNAPIVIGFLSDTVTLMPVNGCEYSTDGINWQSSNIFTGLSPATEYTFYQRFIDNGETDISAGTKQITDKLKQNLVPNAPTLESVTDSSITLVAVEGCEYSNDGVNWQSSNIFNYLNYGTGYTFYQRYKETDNYYESEKSVGATFKTEKGVPAAPNTPEIESKTHNTVTLKKVEGYEYSRDGVNWQTSNVFTDLEPEANYFFFCRKAETETLLASAMSTGLHVKTDAKPLFIIGDVNGDYKIDTTDLASLKLYLAGNGKVELGADMSEDGKIDTTDLAELKLFLAGV